MEWYTAQGQLSAWDEPALTEASFPNVFCE